VQQQAKLDSQDKEQLELEQQADGPDEEDEAEESEEIGKSKKPESKNNDQDKF